MDDTATTGELKFKRPESMHHFYMFRCKDATLYCGSTNNIQKREALHNSGRGAIYTRIHGGGRIVYTENYSTIQEAMKREREVKKWPKDKKESLITPNKVYKVA